MRTKRWALPISTAYFSTSGGIVKEPPYVPVPAPSAIIATPGAIMLAPVQGVLAGRSRAISSSHIEKP
jgi:hypothetical protein